MPHQRKRGRTIRLHGVAAFAAVFIRRERELAVVLVAVTIEACREFHLEERGLAGGEMALRAFDRRMLALERIGRLRVILHAESCRLESFHRVTRRAFAAVRAPGKLSAMRIGTVTI